MRICGVELKGNNAILAVLETTSNGFEVIDAEPRRITLNDTFAAGELISTKMLIEAFLRDHSVDAVVIKKRAERGLYAGSAVSFKLEGVFQIASSCPVEFVSAQRIASVLKHHPITLPLALNKYQREAFESSYTYIYR